jgi:hypothetical protein
VIRARAGAGKTTIAGLARTEFEAHGLKVVGVAPSLQALAELDDVGLKERESLARTSLADGQFSKIMRTMDHQTVVLIDEAGMAATRDVAPLLDRAAERGAKVVAIGDDVQLAAVGAGGWFRYLAEHQETPVLRLTEVHRQRDPVERDRLNGLHRGDVAGWLRWADQHDRIHVQPTVEDAYADTVDRYARTVDELDGQIDRLVVMAPENAHRRALNEQLRRVVVDRGLVDRNQERNYGGLLVAPGDRLVATKTVTVEGTSTRLVENGERFQVLSAGSSGARALAVAGNRRGKIVRLPVEVLQPTGDGRIVDHAYARTVHKAQGMTVDRSILFSPEPARLGRNLAYVGLTRTRDRADLVTVAQSRPEGLERLARGMGERRDHQAALAIQDPDRLNPARLLTMSAQEVDEHRHTLLTEAREAMTHLTRLDREARGAWAGSGDARTDAQLLAERDQLAARVEERQRHLAERDPDGNRQGRGLMEHTTRQALERDRSALERLDARLEDRELVDVGEADEIQQRIRRARVPVQDYLESLLQRLDDVHGRQVDRSTLAVDPRSVPEHERPALAIGQARERADRVRGLTLSAAQQLGTGHPAVVRWLEQHAPSVERTEERAVERDPGRQAPPSKIAPTVHQREFMEALRDWRATNRAVQRLGEPGELEVLLRAQTQLANTDRAVTEAERNLTDHEQQKPSRLRLAATDAWTTRRADLQELVEQRAVEHRTARQKVAGLEQERGGRPLAQRIDELRAGDEQLTRSRDRAVAVEQSLARTGPAGVDQKHLERVLGRREDVTATKDLRRYDELAGRLAVGDVVRSQRDSSERWVQTVPLPDRGVALWRQERGMDLSPAQLRVVERHQETDRNQDRGPDLGR